MVELVSGPGNFDWLGGRILLNVLRCECNVDSVFPDNDAFDPIKQDVRGNVLFLQLLSYRGADEGFDLWRRNPRDSPGLMLSATQSRADVKPIANAVLARKARAHAIAFVVKELAT